MPLYIKDNTAAKLVARLAKKRGVSKQEAVRAAVQVELNRIDREGPPRLTRDPIRPPAAS